MAAKSLAPARPVDAVGTAPATTLDPHYPELDLAGCPGLLVVAAHPDDELLGLGATMAALVGRGVEVRVVAVADRAGSTPLTGNPALDRQLPGHRFDQRVVAGILGVAEPLHLGLPAEQLDRHTAQVTDQLTAVLAELPSGTWCAAPWGGDDDADSRIVAAAAEQAAARVGARPLQYPVWFRHWAAAGLPTLPWDRVHTVAPPAAALERKHDAAQWFIGSFRPDARAAVASVLWPMLAAGETVFV